MKSAFIAGPRYFASADKAQKHHHSAAFNNAQAARLEGLAQNEKSERAKQTYAIAAAGYRAKAQADLAAAAAELQR